MQLDEAHAVRLITEQLGKWLYDFFAEDGKESREGSRVPFFGGGGNNTIFYGKENP